MQSLKFKFNNNKNKINNLFLLMKHSFYKELHGYMDILKELNFTNS